MIILYFKKILIAHLTLPSIQYKFQDVQIDLQTKGDCMMETIRSVEEFLAERGEDLSPEERANLQATLTHMKEQYHTLKGTAQSSLAQLDSTINTTLQQNTQRVKISSKYISIAFLFFSASLSGIIFFCCCFRLKQRSSCMRLREK